jgi:hypothetical protein
MRYALLRAASSCLEAALFLAAFAASMRGAVGCAACNSRRRAAIVLAPFASAVRLAVRRASSLNLLGAALQLTLPPAHGTPPGSRWRRPTPIHSRHPPPLSPQRSTSAHRTPYTRGGSARAGKTLGSACLDKVVNSAWAGDVRWVCSRAGWTETRPLPPPPGSQAACASLPLLQTLMVRSNTPTPHRYTASTARRRDTLE